MGVSGGRRDKEKEVEKGKNTEARSASEGKVVPGGKPSSMRRKIIQTPGSWRCPASSYALPQSVDNCPLVSSFLLFRCLKCWDVVQESQHP